MPTEAPPGAAAPSAMALETHEPTGKQIIVQMSPVVNDIPYYFRNVLQQQQDQQQHAPTQQQQCSDTDVDEFLKDY